MYQVIQCFGGAGSVQASRKRTPVVDVASIKSLYKSRRVADSWLIEAVEGNREGLSTIHAKSHRICKKPSDVSQRFHDLCVRADCTR